MLRRLLPLLPVLQAVHAFYLPGVAPRDYQQGDQVDLLVNSLTPTESSNLRSLVSYDYYHPEFHHCEPEGGPKKQPEGLGSILFGDRIFNSPFQLNMLQNETCKTLCKTAIPAEDAKFVNARIEENYAVNWLVDGLPAAELKQDEKTREKFYSVGFALGDENKGRKELHNHYDIYLYYHSRPNNFHRVVGVVVWPVSTHSLITAGATTPDCSVKTPMMLREDAENNIAYTYSVYWVPSSTPWATRWDNYLKVFDPRIHWFSLINSIVIVIFLCIMVSMILIRTLKGDINRYNAIDLADDVQDDYGWKLVHGEVFRSPNHPMLLSILVGSGSQLSAMAGVTLVFALLGFLSPSNRGALATMMVICFTFFGVVAGYFSSRTYVSLGGKAERKNTFLTATVFPTVIFAVLFLLNLFLIGSGSSGAVPFGTLLAVVALWFLVSVPLTVGGAYFGNKHGAISHPVRVNQIPRQIPPKVWYLRTWPSALIAGILPFGAAFIEIYFILSSLFGSQYYIAFGFLALTSAVVCLTSATVTILMTYFVLCAEEYRWHWRAFLTGGAAAFWVWLYGAFYWASRLSLDNFASTFLYFGYLTLISVVVFLSCGTVGFLSAYWAVRQIYERVRVD